MMNKSVFKRIITTEDLDNMLRVSESVLAEHGGNRMPTAIDGSDLPELNYLVSSCKEGYIAANYFTYRNPENNLIGIAKAKCASDDIKPVTTEQFTQVQFLDDRSWVVRCPDGLIRILIDWKQSNETFEDVDVLRLQPNLLFYQFDSSDGTRSLACHDTAVMSGGLFFPKDADDFINWYRNAVIKYGSEGRLDGNRVSTIFQVYFEVMRSIFMTARYKCVTFS